MSLAGRYPRAASSGLVKAVSRRHRIIQTWLLRICKDNKPEMQQCRKRICGACLYFPRACCQTGLSVFSLNTITTTSDPSNQQLKLLEAFLVLRPTCAFSDLLNGLLACNAHHTSMLVHLRFFARSIAFPDLPLQAICKVKLEDPLGESR